ncbi:putative O-methyltransferase [Lophiostoma macrostomum CBS 122681]|uniref:Putative O-methyltransferase n=1 Tax=Lophiostoma macrostomum CBS 122681 TaxID=1314788 RepID=A0A6A6T8H5_9PLEO|nr:putative O-methyltransferase [Lophiostoma macrostomum CBS 122681]
MSSQSRIAQLAATVARNTTQIDEDLDENKRPYPSFESSGPVDLGLPQDLEQLRNQTLQTSQELNDLLQGPRDLLFNHQHNQLVYLKFISRFDIAHKVPLNGDITFTELAADLGVDEAALRCILRMGIAYRIFREPRPGNIAHSAASKQIAEDVRMASSVGANVDEMWPSATKLVDALVQWPQAAEPNQTGFALSHDTESSFFAEISKDPERARRFGNAMSFFTTGEGYSLSHLTDGYDWGAFESGTVVDLGGSHGDAAFALARKYPGLFLIVQELPEVIANAKEESDLNVKFMAHDFFEEQPVRGADVFLFRWTLHNWPNKYCIEILRALVPALKKGARVVVQDLVMPPPGVLPNDLDRKMRAMDLTMLEISNSRERELADWEQVFAQADSKFVFKGMRQPPGSRLAILEFAWEG